MIRMATRSSHSEPPVTITAFNTEAEWRAARHCNINSTEVAALFGMGSYATAFEIALEKQQSEPSELEQSERMTWGKRLQDAIAQGVADDYGVSIESMELVYGQHPDARLGSSFDYKIIRGGATNHAANGLNDRAVVVGPGLLEIKNVDSLQYKRNWIDGEAPDQIEIQLQTQLEVLDLPWGCIAAFVGGNKIEMIIRERDRKVGAAIVTRVRDFWINLDKGILPDPIMPEDARCLIALYQYAEPEKLYDGAGDAELAGLCRSYAAASEKERAASESKKVLKAKILQRIGDAERAVLPGFKVSAGMVAEAAMAYTRPSYRNLRITEIKEKASV
jgi:predicted phage-related endonuclease